MPAGSLPDHVQPQGVPSVPEQAVLGDAHPVQQWSVGLHVCCHLYSYLHHDPSGMPCSAAAALTRTNCMHLLAIIQLYSFLCQDPSSVSLCLALSAERYVMQFSSLTLNDCMTGMTYKSPQCFTMTLIE